MKIFNTMKKTTKETSKLPMNGKVKRGFRFYCAVIAALTLVMGMSVWSYVKKKYKLNMNSILIFLIMPLQFRVSSILSSNFSHVCSAIRNYNDYEPLPCYKMSRYIQIQAYMHAYNPLF